LQGKVKVLGLQHPETLVSSHNLASALRKLERYEEAEEHALDAWKGREKVLGPGHRDTLSSLALLGRMQAEQGKYAESEASTTKALGGLRELQNPDEQELLDTVATLAWIYDNHGRSKEVMPLYAQTLVGIKQVDGAIRRYSELCSKRRKHAIGGKDADRHNHRANTYARNSEFSICLLDDAS
jgi:tetratricopeptide (TPR) repeat protein